jgi:protein FRG1
VGAVEQWEVVFEEEKMALLSHSGHFMSIDPKEETLVCKSRKAGPSEILHLRFHISYTF